MADVARPRALGNRTVRARHHSSRTPGRSRSGHHSASPEDINYAMDVILQPPPTARAGLPLGGNIIVRLRTLNADIEDALADSTNLVAVATLIPGPNSTGSTDPVVLNTLLAGRRFDSIHPFSDDEADGLIGSMEMNNDPRGVGYMYFPELTIRQAGTYRIRITLIRIRNSSSDPPVASAAGGASVQIVDSNPILVQSTGSSSNLAAYNGDDDDDEDDGGWLDVLRSLQTRRRSP
ncbi:hypothetical protein BU24DRAFT_408809 [Aaosphaeria arxii CBS 175.79]|uniref:Velvet domain-containing protein n=1 Tax=Aaosphaeria arxii CBS 175.79 TaxID=1450172 RepID=A0A6A5XRT0_9PLEO|nr:uncharacterized protein BU24DRAFT_408809 [Aaosphaeria arxii CBS 175.79]KAF2015609.1 hypothetical protein BU24DRAFT_408809 [Aaosphaeria arxii CBS 175.79]